jgi:hypothetical protein
MYDIIELEQIDKGIVSTAFEDDIQQMVSDSEDSLS